jgi:hypothetical protein
VNNGESTLLDFASTKPGEGHTPFRHLYIADGSIANLPTAICSGALMLDFWENPGNGSIVVGSMGLTDGIPQSVSM